MNPVNSTENIIYPPGNKLDTTVTVTSIGFMELGTSFNQPLPTLVQAIKSEDNLSIKIAAIVLIDTKIECPKLIVNQLFSMSSYGETQLQVFIHCDEEEISKILSESSGTTYKAFKVEFTTDNFLGFPKGIEIKDIKYVQTFLWNIDPKTSRGTVTIVQDATL
ncbi:hypothetical protein FIA58_019480 [Flavobacterium jejuense]|uniref:Uncharacterized protein n=1 Tax=Flavobacterium jejuense TaxID=1544455 RepID=A0ABX0IX98_9FLAO|nr:hypothetical protein [Flavobacterium jejuense]NHN27865.1 hypothetical protein [Flavobacterium jejuense]